MLIGVGSLDKSVLASIPKNVLLFDLIAQINTMVFELPLTYEEFTKKLMQRIPKNYKRVDLLAYDYKNKANSLRLNEQGMHGQSERIQIASLQSRIRPEFRTRILRNNENKARLIELMLIYIKEQKDEYFNLLKSDTIVFSTEGECFLLTFAGISNITELETDTKIITQAMHLREAHDENVTIFSHCGDTDIIVLLLAFLQDHKEHNLIIDRHGDDKKTLKLSELT